MTLLSICQDTADVVGLTRPTAIMTGQDQLSRQLLGFAKETLEELSLMDWPVLNVPYTFTTVSEQQAYTLPSDFGRECGDTVYGKARYSMLRGSLTPGDWARQRNILPGLGFYRFRIYGNPLMLNLTPTPQVAEDIVMEYQTANRVSLIAGGFAPTYQNDTDTSVVPEYLMKKGIKWRIRRAKGLDYTEEFDDYEIARSNALAQQLQMGSIPVAYKGIYDSGDIPIGYVPETGYGIP